jgi:hypothetical protein
MKEIIEINRLELASELAERRIIKEHGHDIYIKDRPENFTDHFQDIFNEYYEYYLDIIEELELF